MFVCGSGVCVEGSSSVTCPNFLLHLDTMIKELRKDLNLLGKGCNYFAGMLGSVIFTFGIFV